MNVKILKLTYTVSLWSALTFPFLFTTGQRTTTVVLVRHGQSVSNLSRKFSGWDDVPLTEEGMQQAKRAGIALREAGFKFDVAHTSLLTRAQQTLQIILDELGQQDLPVGKSWRLNERHFGAFTGMPHTTERRVSLFAAPPEMKEDHPFYDAIHKDSRYKDVEEIPRAESLNDTIDRTRPYWNETIAPQIREGKRVLIVAHHHLLKGLALILEKDKPVENFRIPNATPCLYEFDENLKPIRTRKFVDAGNSDSTDVSTSATTKEVGSRETSR